MGKVKDSGNPDSSPVVFMSRDASGTGVRLGNESAITGNLVVLKSHHSGTERKGRSVRRRWRDIKGPRHPYHYVSAYYFLHFRLNCARFPIFIVWTTGETANHKKFVPFQTITHYAPSMLTMRFRFKTQSF